MGGWWTLRVSLGQTLMCLQSEQLVTRSSVKCHDTLWALHTEVFLPCLPPGLRNDHKAVMRVIEQKLHEIHSEVRRRKSESGSEGEGVPRPALPGTFARVSMVAEGSPSALAVRTAQCVGSH